MQKVIEIEEFHKEIELIEACINRMANNSFMLKGWAISLVTVIFSISFAQNKITCVILLIMILTTFAFWYLDAYYLRIENEYRAMYRWVLEKRKDSDRTLQYDLDPSRFEGNVDGIFKTMFSKTLRVLYGIIILVVIAITFCLQIGGLL